MRTEREIRADRAALDTELDAKMLELQERRQRLNLDVLAVNRWYNDRLNELTAELITVQDGEDAATTYLDLVRQLRISRESMNVLD